MVAYDIDGITVDFPYEAYPCQLIYMQRVIACLNQGWNGALESPTGTGKTLCLLCASLAWQRQQKQLKISQTIAELAHSVPSLAKNGNQELQPYVIYPKILYTSRTHSQLSQVVRELNKTVYKNVKICMLGSRDQFCINEDVKSEQNSSIKNHLCRAKVKSRTCQFYIGYDALINNQKILPSITENGVAALDIEDYISYGRKYRVCPFFTSRSNQEDADLIVMPYNYVIDGKARKANKINLNNKVLIFDEAHNLEKVCEECASITFTSKDVAASLREAKEALNSLMNDEDACRKEMENTTAAFGESSSGSQLPDIRLQELADLIILLENLEREIDKITLQNHDDKPKSSCNLPGVSMPGSFIFELLEKAGIHGLMRDAIDMLIDKVTAYLTQKASNSIWQSRGIALQKFASLLNTVLVADTRDVELKNYSQYNNDFKVYVCADEENQKRSTTITAFAKNSRKPGLVLNYWCFSAGLSMNALISKGVRSVLLTSGTLSPLQHFVTEMKIPFQLTLQNQHVIDQEQVWFGVICKGPDGTSLNASYANRQSDTYISSLGNLLANVFRLVPHGCLVFFSSYSQLTMCVERWQNSDIWKRLEKHKMLFVEPRGKEQFHKAINDYNEYVKDKGAAFLAVCRGKVSEGIDFADSAGRAVVIVGIPYPPMYDPRVVLKKTQKSIGGTVDGETWYAMEAVRAVNQAVGRVIRHRNDYGAVVLADQRFTTWGKDRFPSWIASSYAAYQNFGEASKSLATFFKDKNLQTDPATVEDKDSTSVQQYAMFGLDSSVKQKGINREIQCDDLYNPKKPKMDFTSYTKKSDSFMDLYGSKNTVCDQKAPPTSMDKGDMWSALNVDRTTTEDSKDSARKPEETPAYHAFPVHKEAARRTRIKITTEPSNGDKNLVRSNKPCVLEVVEIDASKNEEKSAPYIRMAKQRLGKVEFNRLTEQVKEYKRSGCFEGVLDYWKSLDYNRFADVIEGFEIFVRCNDKQKYKEWVESKRG